eukprot:1161214-Pelagomonas_calceolata.AAC.10
MSDTLATHKHLEATDIHTLSSADLGFFVAIDGAMRIPRNLPSAALTTFAPPGSFYQVNDCAPLCIGCALLVHHQAASTRHAIVHRLASIAPRFAQLYAPLCTNLCTVCASQGSIKQGRQVFSKCSSRVDTCSASFKQVLVKGRQVPGKCSASVQRVSGKSSASV